MTSAQSTPEYNITISPHRPYYRWLLLTLTVLGGLLLALCSYYMGYYQGASIEQDIVLERDALRQSDFEKGVMVKQLEQKVANLVLGSKVDRRATEEVRAQVVLLKDRIAELEQDNTFYRDLMRPKDNKRGLSIGVPAITLLEGANTYDYKIVVKQLASNHPQIGGYLEFTLVGKEGDLQRKIALKELSTTITSERVKLNFRYFQKIEGKMVLPDNFKPDRIEVKVVSVRPKKVLIEKTFSWTVNEG